METVISIEKMFKNFKYGQRHPKHSEEKKVTEKKVAALKNISLEIQKNECFGIVGNNGAGKSTLLRMIAGVYTPTSGNVKTKGSIISIIGVIFGLKDRLSVKENIYIISALFGLSQIKFDEVIKKIIVRAHLEKKVNEKIFTLSNGQLARLVFATAIECKPDILLLDEITSNIDNDYIEEMKDTIHDKQKNEGMTVVMVSHRKDIIIECCNRALILERGEVSMCDTAENIVQTYWGNH